MAGNDEPSLDLDGDSSGDFVLPTRRVVLGNHCASFLPPLLLVRRRRSWRWRHQSLISLSFSLSRRRTVLQVLRCPWTRNRLSIWMMIAVDNLFFLESLAVPAHDVEEGGTA